MKISELIPSDSFILKGSFHLDPIPVFMVVDYAASLKNDKVSAVKTGYHGHGHISQFDLDTEVLKLD